MFSSSIRRWMAPREIAGNCWRSHVSRRSRGSVCSIVIVSSRPGIDHHSLCRLGVARRLFVRSPGDDEKKANANADGAIRDVEGREAMLDAAAGYEMEIEE